MVGGYLAILRWLHHFPSSSQRDYCEGSATVLVAGLHASLVSRDHLHASYEFTVVLHAVQIPCWSHRRPILTWSITYDIFMVYKAGVTITVSTLFGTSCITITDNDAIVWPFGMPAISSQTSFPAFWLLRFLRPWTVSPICSHGNGSSCSKVVPF